MDGNENGRQVELSLPDLGQIETVSALDDAIRAVGDFVEAPGYAPGPELAEALAWLDDAMARRAVLAADAGETRSTEAASLPAAARRRVAAQARFGYDVPMDPVDSQQQTVSGGRKPLHSDAGSESP